MLCLSETSRLILIIAIVTVFILRRQRFLTGAGISAPIKPLSDHFGRSARTDRKQIRELECRFSGGNRINDGRNILMEMRKVDKLEVCKNPVQGDESPAPLRIWRFSSPTPANCQLCGDRQQRRSGKSTFSKGGLANRCASGSCHRINWFHRDVRFSRYRHIYL